ncbi:hypothetical protein PULV_a1700 [Pseudoalteromonas ulvae UL12]|uniref:DUF1842 domain-containing protein n=1 Tax=Pseudoalteromonas ulvae TaxID=107327 RepID=UPI00186B7D5E|nr:DUF1842 domain-containing protein [Pseudoalteromonas ulvae]MBE0364134.1 hypothetical protein [Pseudoalteromonas ulvae UL12]
MGTVNVQLGGCPLTYHVRANSKHADPLAINELLLHVLVDISEQTLSGVGHLMGFGAHSTLNSSSFIYGDWCVSQELKATPILVVADGVFPQAVFSEQSCAERENLKLTLSLRDDWKTGFANIVYFEAGQWVEMNAANVTLSACGDVEQLNELCQQFPALKMIGH